MIKKCTTCLKKSLLDTFPLLFWCLCMPTILETVRWSSADTYHLYQLGSCLMITSFCKKVSAIRQYCLSISLPGLQHEVVDILRISLNLPLGALQGGGYRWGEHSTVQQCSQRSCSDVAWCCSEGWSTADDVYGIGQWCWQQPNHSAWPGISRACASLS